MDKGSVISPIEVLKVLRTDNNKMKIEIQKKTEELQSTLNNYNIVKKELSKETEVFKIFI